MADELTALGRISQIEDHKVRDRLTDIMRDKFALENAESTKDILVLYGYVFDLLAHDIIGAKKAEAFCKILSGAGSCKKDFLTIEFPAELLKQCNDTLEKWKLGIISALKHVLSEEQFSKVMKEIGKSLGWSEPTKDPS